MALVVILVSCKEADRPRPNFVFILVDDLGWADIGSNWPETFYETPHIDKLAQNGVRFTQAYAAHPVCSPTRAALMTGKHPNRVNITDWIPGFDQHAAIRPILTPQINHELALEEETIAEKFKAEGYNTFFVGKWHLGEQEKYWPEYQGFDVNVGGWSVGAPQLKPGVSNGYFSPYGNPRLEDGPEGEYLEDRLVTESIKLIQGSKDTPFLLYLSFYAVHTPIQAVADYHEKFIHKKEETDFITGDRYIKEGDEGVTKLIQDNTAYASMVAAMDGNVGKIVEALREAGLDDNTWIIFTSDNGGLSTLFTEGAPTANGPLRAGKGWCYEGGIRVPLVVYGPGLQSRGKVVDTPVVSMDYFTTMLSLAGIDHEPNDGVDLSPLLLMDKDIQRDELFWHYPHYHGSGWKPGSAIRLGDWKLIHYYENDSVELFNLAVDPKEESNLVFDSPDRTEELFKRLRQRLTETGAMFPERREM